MTDHPSRVLLFSAIPQRRLASDLPRSHIHDHSSVATHSPLPQVPCSQIVVSPPSYVFIQAIEHFGISAASPLLPEAGPPHTSLLLGLSSSAGSPLASALNTDRTGAKTLPKLYIFAEFHHLLPSLLSRVTFSRIFPSPTKAGRRFPDSLQTPYTHPHDNASKTIPRALVFTNKKPTTKRTKGNSTPEQGFALGPSPPLLLDCMCV